MNPHPHDVDAAPRGPAAPTAPRSRSLSTYFNYPLAFFLCTAWGVICFAAALLTASLTSLASRTVCVLSAVLYALGVAVTVLILRRGGRTTSRHEVVLHRFDQMLDAMVFPYLITNASGTIIKCNRAAEGLFARKMPGIMPNVSSVLPFLTPEAIRRSVNAREEIQRKTGDAEHGEMRYYVIESTETELVEGKKEHDPVKGTYYLTTMVDITEEKERQLAALRRLDSETAVVGRVEIDDLKAFTAASGMSEKEAADKVREILTDWTLHQNGLMYEPETRKFMIIMPQIKLNQCMKDKFPVLDTIREALSTKDDELTVSMGFSSTGETLAERAKNADVAFEMRKSGNKAVVNNGGEFSYFGKDRRRQVTRDTAEYRRISNSLRKFFADSGNVLIMGHSRPDFDCIGAAIGVGKLASDFGKEWQIVMNDPGDINFARLTEDIRGQAAYDGKFISEARAIDKVRSDTLLIVVDVNNAANFESPDLYRTIRSTTGGRVMLFDHHEKTDATASCDYEYIDPACSSACEIVSGVLDFMLHNERLTPEEATILLAGIMLDTKNFTQYSSQKTYAAAEYLHLSSARPERVKKFFEADSETFRAEYRIGSNLTLEADGRVAICRGEGLADEGKTKVVIGRVADHLLTMEGVMASIVIAAYEGRINASARSNNNRVNCAELMRGVGGGNFNNAGARVTDRSEAAFDAVIRENIEHYFKNNVDEEQPGGTDTTTESV